MDVSTRLRGGPCEGDCHHLFRRAKIAFDAGAPKIAQRRVNEGLSAINNCRAYEAQTQALASTDEEIDCENSEDAEGATERPDRDDFKLNQSKIMKVIDSNLGEAGLDGAAPAPPAVSRNFSLCSGGFWRRSSTGGIPSWRPIAWRC
jgi:hypothetical protein